ncbi:autotransporter outer membrane beta-barrel domain-containing protein [Zavarzinia aquatilis]|uniref:Autotransporter domain-containing protein n=1 Tax=Zavarzinia aquatilis TaxID=2211142 RepID=A0A317DZQ2_9PROT|nr:autotransporter outer membrane beta-barrel domain-containing protein [Zavarzinia aquatilis]PWR19356.1 hypothetical protein DKG74_17950 [Zavarzinia aquatilis]
MIGFVWRGGRPYGPALLTALLGVAAPASAQVVEPTDTSRISGWGSSTMEYLAPYLSNTAAGFGAGYYDGGDAAARAASILARQGSAPALVSFPGGSAPASGSVSVSVGNVPSSAAIESFTGTFQGSSLGGSLSSSATAWTFTRDGTGSATTVAPGTAFLPTEGMANRYSIQLLNIGKNDLTAGASAQSVVDAVATAYDWIPTSDKKALVLGFFVDSGTAGGAAVRTRIDDANSALRATYGADFVDIGAYVTSAQVWTDTGLTPTATDLAQQALGNLPPSLAADSQHLNGIANAAVVNKLILPRLEAYYGRAATDLFAPADINGILFDAVAGEISAERSARHLGWSVTTTQRRGTSVFAEAGGRHPGDATAGEDDYAFRLGLEHVRDANWSFRLSAGRLDRFDSSTPDVGDFSGWSVMLSGDWRSGGYRLGSTLGYLWGDAEGRRAIPASTLAPAYSAPSSALFGEIEAGYALSAGAFTIIPSALLRYQADHVDSYRENGRTGLELAYGGKDSDALTGGLTLTTTWDTGMWLKPWLNLAYEHRFDTGGDNVTGDFIFLSRAPVTGAAAQGQDDRVTVEPGVSISPDSASRIDLSATHQFDPSLTGARLRYTLDF